MMLPQPRSHQIHAGRGDLHPCLLRVRSQLHEHGQSDAEADQRSVARRVPYREPLELVDTRDGHIIVAGDLRPPVIDMDVLDDSLSSGSTRIRISVMITAVGMLM